MSIRVQLLRALSILVGTLLSLSGIPGMAAPSSFHHLEGTNPVSRWGHSQPAACALGPPHNMYPVSSVINEDYHQFPFASGKKAQWIYGKTAQIEAFYDSNHRLAIFREFGTDDSYSALFANVDEPAFSVEHARLSSIAMAGKVRLGDSQHQVANSLGVHPTFSVPAAEGCGAFRVAGFCSWKSASCACPSDRNPSGTVGTVVLRNGRVVAMAWDKSYC